MSSSIPLVFLPLHKHHSVPCFSLLLSCNSISSSLIPVLHLPLFNYISLFPASWFSPLSKRFSLLPFLTFPLHPLARRLYTSHRFLRKVYIPGYPWLCHWRLTDIAYLLIKCILIIQFWMKKLMVQIVYLHAVVMGSYSLSFSFILVLHILFSIAIIISQANG